MRVPTGYYSGELEGGIRDITSGAPEGVNFGVAVIDTKGGALIAGVNEDMRTEALSLSKLLTSLAVVRAIPNLSAHTVILQPSDERDLGGKSFLHRYIGKDFDASAVLRAMLRVSDTTGQRALVREVGGPGEVNRLARSRLTTGLAISGLVLAEGEIDKPTAKFWTGYTTPYEAATTLWAAEKHPTAHEALCAGAFKYGLLKDLHLISPNMMGLDVPEGYVHDVAKINSRQGSRSVIVASLSEGWPGDLPETPHHPAHTIHARLGTLISEFVNQP